MLSGWYQKIRLVSLKLCTTQEENLMNGFSANSTKSNFVIVFNNLPWRQGESLILLCQIKLPSLSYSAKFGVMSHNHHRVMSRGSLKYEKLAKLYSAILKTLAAHCYLICFVCQFNSFVGFILSALRICSSR